MSKTEGYRLAGLRGPGFSNLMSNWLSASCWSSMIWSRPSGAKRRVTNSNEVQKIDLSHRGSPPACLPRLISDELIVIEGTRYFVSWVEAHTFCVWRGKRLPTDAGVGEGGPWPRLSFPAGKNEPMPSCDIAIVDQDDEPDNGTEGCGTGFSWPVDLRVQARTVSKT